MSSNGASSSPPHSPGSAPRTSLDRLSSPPLEANGLSGHTPVNVNGHGADETTVEGLQQQLQQTREEKDALASQYRNLLAKLTTMRTTLGNKLQKDAEELDRREQQIQQLSAQSEDYAATIEALKEEVVTSNEEASRLSSELSELRTRALQENSHESMMRERELRETQMELERCRMERDEWERVALQERVAADEAEGVKREIERERELSERLQAELAQEKENEANLQSVLQDFQAAKDHELRQAVKDYESQLMQVTQSLAEYKHRALTAELKLEENEATTSRTQELEKEVKDKTILINKLRHEAVIINEHLTESLRRLRASTTSSSQNVDRRLVTNVLLSFITTPREDSKRFEMLGLLATILGWGDSERIKAGLQRGSGGGTPLSGGGFWGRKSTSTQQDSRVDQTDETESFSRLWVEFLLTETSAGTGNPPKPGQFLSGSRLPHTPSRSSFQLRRPGEASVPEDGTASPTRSAFASPTRLGSRSLSSSAMASSPNLTLSSASPPPPVPPLPASVKGKEKATDQ
ncbi:hypothetical protein BD626DRAFT_548013 [Schizophyllum amplum]|uniref:GRIP domain-containing protein n=1 Tax=Schizophyllum amplum TaxID=97359 RepID=A0A550CFU0_9AGAR|nr:hypothetical protein BD626DRAFT_548013 [Auriculariopsis ampla]